MGRLLEYNADVNICNNEGLTAVSTVYVDFVSSSVLLSVIEHVKSQHGWLIYVT